MGSGASDPRLDPSAEGGDAEGVGGGGAVAGAVNTEGAAGADGAELVHVVVHDGVDTAGGEELADGGGARGGIGTGGELEAEDAKRLG